MGKRIRELEDAAGNRIDELAKALLRYELVRRPASRIARSRPAWMLAQRMDRVRSRRLAEQIVKQRVPEHVGIIMDGNRRFAKVLGLKDVGLGHVAGQERLENVLDWCLELGIKALTVYAFSTENFQRADAERDLLMELFEHNFRKMAVDPRVHTHKIRVRTIGHLEMLPAEVQEAAHLVMDATKDYDAYNFNVAIAYGGRQEIVDAVRKVAAEAASGKLNPQDITDETIRARLYTPDLPDPDFIIRTSGEERVSNFLLWQLAYAELYFADVNWPDLGKHEFLKAIDEFQRRQRRYGQ